MKVFRKEGNGGVCLGRCSAGGDCRRPFERGSVLLMVLWILAMIAMLSGEYLAHNRSKAGIAINATRSMERRHAMASVLELLTLNAFNVPEEIGKAGAWCRIPTFGMEVWVQVAAGDTALNLNSAADPVIREKIRQMLGEDRSMAADGITDAILDWRDDNDLVRANGAEEDDYAREGFSYMPADGPFKVLTELLLVKGVTRELFWGDPLASVLQETAEEAENEGEKESPAEGSEKASIASATPRSLAEAFSIHTGNVKRVSIILKDSKMSYEYALLYLQQSGGKGGGRLLSLHRTTLFAPKTGKEDSEYDLPASAGHFSHRKGQP